MRSRIGGVGEKPYLPFMRVCEGGSETRAWRTRKFRYWEMNSRPSGDRLRGLHHLLEVWEVLVKPRRRETILIDWDPGPG